ncbi:unnamed protein product [Chilo suppressalis]|uniref:FP protein C-terminal domain-containing protein n=1 Tax=Chilo suppressalis TaxID=168631 RepID=A0ABN8AXN8_CHISP|nr:unnamed protein product [Chilo suppressalis]
MMRSPAKKQDATYGSAPNLNISNVSEAPNEQDIVIRSVKRRRCDCGPSEESKLDAFIQTLSSWRDETNNKLSSLQTSMNDIKTQNKELILSNSEIEKSIEFLALKYDDLCLQLNGFQEKAKVSDERLIKLEGCVEEFERNFRSSAIEIRNLPIKIKPTQEHLITISMKIFKELSIDVSMLNIYDVRIIPTESVNKTIILNLNSIILKNKIIKAFRDYNRQETNIRLNSSILETDQPQQWIYISENLTMRARRLFHLARDFAKTNNFKHCWTANGRILLRKEDNVKPIVVTSETQLNDIQAKN